MRLEIYPNAIEGIGPTGQLARLYLQVGSQLVESIQGAFELQFELGRSRSGEPRWTHPAIVRAPDHRDFIYLSWHQVSEAEAKPGERFGRIKLYLHQLDIPASESNVGNSRVAHLETVDGQGAIRFSTAKEVRLS